MSEDELKAIEAKLQRDPGDPLAAECVLLIAEARQLRRDLNANALVARDALRNRVAERDAALAKLAEVTRERDELRVLVNPLHGACAAALETKTLALAASQARCVELMVVGEAARHGIAELIVAGCTSDADMADVMPRLIDTLARPDDRSALDAMLAEARDVIDACWAKELGVEIRGDRRAALAEHDARVAAEARVKAFDLDAVAVAQLFHETYERLAPSHGYETRKASAKPWAEVPEQNRALMIATCLDVLRALATKGGGKP